LIAEVFGQSVLKPDGGLIIHALVRSNEGESVSKVLLRETLHTNEQTTAVIRAAGPLFYMFVDLFPSAKVEIPNTKISSVRQNQSLFKRGEEGVIDIIEYSWHYKRARSSLNGLYRPLKKAAKKIGEL
jgi:hypothetical protein